MELQITLVVVQEKSDSKFDIPLTQGLQIIQITGSILFIYIYLVLTKQDVLSPGLLAFQVSSSFSTEI